MRMHRRAAAIALVTLAVSTPGSRQLWAQGLAPTGTPVGTWLNEDKEGIVEIGDCGVFGGGAPTNLLCGKVVWLKNPIDPKTRQPLADNKNVDPAQRGRPIMGMHPILDMKPSNTAGRWDGRVYDLDTGKTYDGSLIVKSATQMRVQGCQFFICQGEEWVRQAVPQAAPARPAGNNGRPAPPSTQPRAR
ncbi:MAG: DUF2147 domain-containing protein [Xanthobacteraceae bacterium]